MMYRSSLLFDISEDSISVHSRIISISFSKFNYSYSFQKEENLFQISWRFSKYLFNRKWIYCDSFRQEVNFIQLIDFFHFFNRKRIYFRYLSTFSRDSISIGSVLLSQVGRLWMAFQLNFLNEVFPLFSQKFSHRLTLQHFILIILIWFFCSF